MSIDPNEIRLEGGPSGGRYFYRFADGSEAEMAFAAQRPGVVTITHTGTPRQHRGQGVAAALVARSIEDFRAAGHKVIPACWFARDEFEAHPEWADLLFRQE
jgi:predicted GNAT family acetyltransferase